MPPDWDKGSDGPTSVAVGRRATSEDGSLGRIDFGFSFRRPASLDKDNDRAVSLNAHLTRIGLLRRADHPRNVSLGKACRHPAHGCFSVGEGVAGLDFASRLRRSRSSFSHLIMSSGSDQ